MVALTIDFESQVEKSKVKFRQCEEISLRVRELTNPGRCEPPWIPERTSSKSIKRGVLEQPS